MRALAQRSAEAAKEIKTLISASTSEVEQGVELVDQTGKALEKIVGQVADIDRVIVQIANGSREQATAFAEVNITVGQLDQNTQKNAAMFEQTTAATHNLRRETEGLVDSVSGFRITERKASHSQPRKAASRIEFKHMARAGGGAAVRKPAPRAEPDGWEEF